jgi:anti-sigma factor RsiW
MNCDQALLLLHPYLDGELDVVESLQIVQHLGQCADCEQSRAQIQDLGKLVAAADLRRSAPAALKDRIRADLMRSERPARIDDERKRRRQLIALAVAAAVLLAAVGLGIGRWGSFGPSSQELLASDVTTAHVRSLLVNHLVDVPSSDRHTVKPWFIGKLDFAPPVVDLSDRGFELVGGRLDVVDVHPVAALVYRVRQHVINVFVWPTSQTANSPISELTRRGYTLLNWNGTGRVCWVISDLNAGELRDFASEFRQRLEQPSG